MPIARSRTRRTTKARTSRKVVGVKAKTPGIRVTSIVNWGRGTGGTPTNDVIIVRKS